MNTTTAQTAKAQFSKGKITEIQNLNTSEVLFNLSINKRGGKILRPIQRPFEELRVFYGQFDRYVRVRLAKVLESNEMYPFAGYLSHWTFPRIFICIKKKSPYANVYLHQVWQPEPVVSNENDPMCLSWCATRLFALYLSFEYFFLTLLSLWWLPDHNPEGGVDKK